ncbi:MAG: GNAT family N-acetyltransferase [Chloroflexi bacterium]|nr:GNAT family N-acetyltransferase [Chloroflexota bacterium]
MMFELSEEPIGQLDDFIELLEEVGTRLWQKGVKQWRPGSIREKQGELERLVENGCLVLARENGRLAGGCILSEIALPVWKESTDNAMYVSSVVAARFAAGQGLGEQILDFCLDAAVRRSKCCLRLDCWEGNAFLKQFYQDAGFEMLTAVPEKDYLCRLFEKAVVK